MSYRPDQSAAPTRAPAYSSLGRSFNARSYSLPAGRGSISSWRARLVLCLIMLALASLITRAFWIQGPGRSFYLHQGEIRYEHTIVLPATRGRILDRNGRELAVSLPARSIWAAPNEIPDDAVDSATSKLAPLLGVPAESLKRILASDRSFVYLKQGMTPEAADRVLAQARALDLPGIYPADAFRRSYPDGEVSAHLTGFTGQDGRGEEGLELAGEKALTGQDGQRRVIKDRVGHIVQDIVPIAPALDGQDLTLSIDSKIQYIAYSSLQHAVDKFHAKAGSAVVVDAHTGEILALANVPSFNPEDRAHLSGAQLRDRALTDEFEPGSIMKPFTVSRALDLGRIAPDTLVDTGNGHYTLDGARITDDSGFGVLTVGGVIQKSSNIGATKIALLMRPEEQWSMYEALGLGQAPHIGLPGATAGRVRPWHSWRRIEQATMGYGYGLSASLVQIVHAYTAIANDGRILPLTLMKQDGASSGSSTEGVQVFKPGTAQAVRVMLESVVTKEGTSPDAAVPGYRVGGKSGTAYKQSGHGYDHSKYRASFIGMAPMPSPRVVIAVSVDEPSVGGHFGGQVSGPVFSTIAGEVLRKMGVVPTLPVAPDKSPTTAHVSAMAPAAQAATMSRGKPPGRPSQQDY